LLPAAHALGRDVHPFLSVIVHACVLGHSPGLERVKTGGIPETRVTLWNCGKPQCRGRSQGAPVQAGDRSGRWQERLNDGLKRSESFALSGMRRERRPPFRLQELRMRFAQESQ
jgi:hypothetical protein